MSDLSELSVELDDWLAEKARSGEYPELEGALITGWTLFADRFDTDGEWWWFVLRKPDQVPTLTVGHGEMISRIHGNVEGEETE